MSLALKAVSVTICNLVTIRRLKFALKWRSRFNIERWILEACRVHAMSTTICLTVLPVLYVHSIFQMKNCGLACEVDSCQACHMRRRENSFDFDASEVKAKLSELRCDYPSSSYYL